MNERLADAEIADLLLLEAEATPGPWEFRPGMSMEGDSIECLTVETGTHEPDEEAEYADVLFEREELGDSRVSANWTLLRELRNAVPSVLRELQTLRASERDRDALVEEEQQTFDRAAELLCNAAGIPLMKFEGWGVLAEAMQVHTRELRKMVAELVGALEQGACQLDYVADLARGEKIPGPDAQEYVAHEMRGAITPAVRAVAEAGKEKENERAGH